MSFDLSDGFFPYSTDSTQANGTFSTLYECSSYHDGYSYIGGKWSSSAGYGIYKEV